MRRRVSAQAQMVVMELLPVRAARLPGVPWVLPADSVPCANVRRVPMLRVAPERVVLPGRQG